MVEHDAFPFETRNDASRCDRAVLLLLIGYLYEELVRPSFRLGLPLVARQIHPDLPEPGRQLRR